MRTVHFRFSLHNNLVWVHRFDLAEVNENGIVCWNIQFTFCVFCLLAIAIQEIHKRIVLTGENRKHVRDILLFCFDVRGTKEPRPRCFFLFSKF